MPNSLRRWLLRDRTAGAHAALDAAIGEFGDLTQYRTYLAALVRFRLPMEELLQRVDWPPTLRDWRPKAMSEALARDCRDLDVPTTSPVTEGLTLDGDRLFGALYVLEGSNLGARVLLGRAHALGLGQDYGARHLSLMASDIDTWRAFLVSLEAADPFDIESAVAGSIATFALAGAAFGVAAR